MTDYTTIILQFNEMGEKTGWTYIEIPADVAEAVKPGTKKGYRVKGFLDNFEIRGIALMPMGEGNFILPLNAAMRKGIGKRVGAMLRVRLEEDAEFKFVPSPELIACLEDEPGALDQFNSLAGSRRNYFIKWIDSAKGEDTKAKRIAMTVNAMVRKMDYGQMIRASKGKA